MKQIEMRLTCIKKRPVDIMKQVGLDLLHHETDQYRKKTHLMKQVELRFITS